MPELSYEECSIINDMIQTGIHYLPATSAELLLEDIERYVDVRKELNMEKEEYDNAHIKTILEKYALKVLKCKR